MQRCSICADIGAVSEDDHVFPLPVDVFWRLGILRWLQLEVAMLLSSTLGVVVVTMICVQRWIIILHGLASYFVACRKSVHLAMALALAGLTPLLVGRLDHQDAIVRLNLLKLIKVRSETFRYMENCR